MDVDNFEDLASCFGGSIRVELGDTGKKIEVISLNAGQRAILREYIAAGKEGDFIGRAAFYLSMACPVFGGDVKKVLQIPKDEWIGELFSEALRFNGVDPDADEEAEKNSASGQS